MILDIESIFSSKGLLSKALPSNYEIRQEQKLLAEQIMQAYEEDKILLAEAATGVGKSWAYLIPALIWAASRKEITIVSTHTIALQEQLLSKDIPFLLDLLGLDLQVTLVKGMGNYLCLRKLEELKEEALFLSPQEQRERDLLEDFAQTSLEGSSSQVSFPLSPGMWEKVAAERGACTSVQCPHFKKCFFFKARKQVAESQILLVNHHLLISEMAMRIRPDFKEDKSILPPSYRIILDEAHHIEEIALASFAISIDRLDLIRYLGRIYSEFQPQKSRIGLIKQDLLPKKKTFSRNLSLLLDIEIPAKKKVAVDTLEKLFSLIEQFCETHLMKEQGSEGREKRFRFDSKSVEIPFWKEEVASCFGKVEEDLGTLFSLIHSLQKEMIEDLSELDKESLSPHRVALNFVEEYIMQKVAQLRAFICISKEINRVRWIELSPPFAIKNVILVDAKLDVSKYLQEHLFATKQTAVLCSATLTSDQNFSFVKDQMGLETKEFMDRTEEKIYSSPFDFASQALFLVPKDIPLPHEYGFSDSVAESVYEIIRASQGGCFILFTSYEMLQNVYEKVLRLAKNFPVSFLKQGDVAKQMLISRFKQQKNSVLFATSSFWEGIDIPGDALRCVVITKLPFKVPSEPLFQAISDMYEKEGRDPFREYSLPQACLKFKQGFGRLIRTKSDRGCVVCLDRRIVTKSYGKTFLRSLPPCPVLQENRKDLWLTMKKFYDSK